MPLVKYGESVPRDQRGELIDSRYWRERTEVTHWHLHVTEWSVNDPSRFDTHAGLVERGRRPSDGVAYSPREVADWHLRKRAELARSLRMYEVEAQMWGLTCDGWREAKEESCFRMASLGMDVLGLFRLRGERIAHLNAYAMTDRTCSGEH